MELDMIGARADRLLAVMKEQFGGHVVKLKG